MTAPASLIAMCRDSHALMLEADSACKGQAAIRNAAIVRLVDVYGLALVDVARLTGIKDSVCRNSYYRARGKVKA